MPPQLSDSIYGKPFKVMGQDVIAFTPLVGEICLDVSWPREHIPDEEEMGEISRRSYAIARYCQQEGFFNPAQCNVGIFLRYIQLHTNFMNPRKKKTENIVDDEVDIPILFEPGEWDIEEELDGNEARREYERDLLDES